MPHVNIKLYPIEVTEEQQASLVTALTKALQDNLGCSVDAVSIALEAVEPADWKEKVYNPEIIGRRDLLLKLPNY